MDVRLPTHGTNAQQQDRTMAALANAVYDPSIREPVPGWRALEATERQSMGIAGTHLRDKKSGFLANVYTNDRGGFVVAMAGTDAREVADHVTNVRQAIGLDAKQYDQARELTQKVVSATGPEHVAVTGHSLGGSLATTAALHSGVQAVVFNSAPVHDHQLSRPDADRAAGMAGQVRHYEVPGEFLAHIRNEPDTNRGLPGVRLSLTAEHGRVNPDSTMAMMLLHGMDVVASSMGRNEMFHGEDTRAGLYYATGAKSADPVERSRIDRAVDISLTAYRSAKTDDDIRRARGTDRRLSGEITRGEQPQREGGYLDRKAMRDRQTPASPFTSTLTAVQAPRTATVPASKATDPSPGAGAGNASSVFSRTTNMKGKEPDRDR